MFYLNLKYKDFFYNKINQFFAKSVAKIQVWLGWG